MVRSPGSLNIGDVQIGIIVAVRRPGWLRGRWIIYDAVPTTGIGHDLLPNGESLLWAPGFYFPSDVTVGRVTGFYLMWHGSRIPPLPYGISIRR
jgi:hypothetical protein